MNGTRATLSQSDKPAGLFSILSDEGLRVFFPLAALHAAFWPLFWVVLLEFGGPIIGATPASLWHGYEMLIGTIGAALIGFITTAVPEWTDTKRLQGKTLWILAALWVAGRVSSFIGFGWHGIFGALADCAWAIFLMAYLGCGLNWPNI